METTIFIVQDIILAKFKKDSKFDIKKTNSDFWLKFEADLLHFEKDAKPLYASIYGLELENPERIISKLPLFYDAYIKAEAEKYVLGQTNPTTDFLLQSQNENFNKEVIFLQSLQQAIKNVERKRVKAALPKLYDQLIYEIPDAELEYAIKKKSREDLKLKFKEWDNEILDHAVIQSSAPVKFSKKTKIFSLTWMKYAVAACLVVATGVMFFLNTNQNVNSVQDTNLTTIDKNNSTDKNDNNITKPTIIELADLQTITENAIVQQPEQLGFSDGKKLIIKILSIDASKRTDSLKKYIVTNQNTTSNSIEELKNLESNKSKYIFDGKTLTLNIKFNKRQDAILLVDEQNYLKPLNKPLQLTKVIDSEILEVLKKISFDNE
jgi:hypothetical protein